MKQVVIFISLRSLQLARIQPWCESWWRMSGQSGLRVIISMKRFCLCEVVYERILLLHCNLLASHFHVVSWTSRFNLDLDYSSLYYYLTSNTDVATSPVSLYFLAHLSTKCSGWAIVTGLCLSSVVVRLPSYVVRHSSSVNFFYLKIFSSETAHWILTKLHRNDPYVVLYLSCSRGHNFTLNYIRKTSNDFLSWTANGNLTKLNRKGPWVVLDQNCSNGFDWLHK